MSLNDKQRLFVAEYLRNGFNAAVAYQTIYEVDYDTAKANGSRLLASANVREAIDEELDLLLNDKKELTVEVLNYWKEVIRDPKAGPAVKARISELIAKYWLALGRETQNKSEISELWELFRNIK